MKVTFETPIKVFVYRNLHLDTWSIKCRTRPNYGRVIAHADDILLCYAHTEVNEKGRQKVLQQRRKNVHAGIVGDLVYADISDDFLYDGVTGYDVKPEGFDPALPPTFSRISYNPYRGPHFYSKATGRNIHGEVMDVWFTEYGDVFRLNGLAESLANQVT